MLHLTERCASFMAKRTRRLQERALRQRVLTAGAAPSIFTHMSSEELDALYRLASECPPGSNVLEIGSYLGASSTYLAAGLGRNRSRLYCCDTWQNETMADGPRDTFAEFRTNTEHLDCEIVPIRKRSEQLAAEDLRLPLQLVFIDGNHSYEAVQHDFRLVRPWLAPDGVIAFHDFSQPYFPGVTRVVGEALASGHWIARGFVDSLIWLRRAAWQELPQPDVIEESTVAGKAAKLASPWLQDAGTGEG